jgi:hypothetical protein
MYSLSSMTLRDIDERNYTFVSVLVIKECQREHRHHYHHQDKWSDRPLSRQYESFLVHSTQETEALQMAKEYVSERGFILRRWGNDGKACTCCTCYHVYPRQYKKKALQLYEEGKFFA